MKELDEDALLEEAKRRYPVGTKFKRAHAVDKDMPIINSTGKFKFESCCSVDSIRMTDNNGNFLNDPRGYSATCYFRNNWAEIVEEPKVETKFKVGKWYKINNAWYAKHECIHGSGRYWRHGDRITVHRDFHNKPGNLGDNWKDVSIVLLEDLSEIQQYLPADHPDKIKQEVKEEFKPNITWKIGDYVVFTEDWCRSKKGDIDKIEKLGDGVIALYLEKEGLVGSPLHEECKLKVFPTLQEAQKFSDELLGKSKTSLKVEDLVEGEIYHFVNNTGEYILLLEKSIKQCKNISIGGSSYYKNGNFSVSCDSVTTANSLEEKWLKTCIKQDKFIPKEELDRYDDEGNLIEVKACVKCNTEQEFDFAAVKLNCTQKRWFLSGGHNCINLDAKNHSQSEKHYKDVGYIIYSFDEWLELHNHKEAYEAQFKKDEEFKVGDKVICIKNEGFKIDGFNYSEDLEIGKLYTVIREAYIYMSTKELGIDVKEDSYTHPISNFRKVLPHEIPVENTVTQKPLVFEDCNKLDFEVKWKEPRYIGGVDPISAFSCGIFEQMKKQSPQSRKTPDLIDKTKVEVKIKRTKVKQIKL